MGSSPAARGEPLLLPPPPAGEVLVGQPRRPGLGDPGALPRLLGVPINCADPTPAPTPGGERTEEEGALPCARSGGVGARAGRASRSRAAPSTISLGETRTGPPRPRAVGEGTQRSPRSRWGRGRGVPLSRATAGPETSCAPHRNHDSELA